MAFARLLFPLEAKLAMEIANAEVTAEFAGFLASKGSNGNLREVDLNETPIMQKNRLLSRLEALSKTGIFLPLTPLISGLTDLCSGLPAFH